MRAWYMCEPMEDQRLPHEQAPPAPCSLESLATIGVLYWHLDASLCVTRDTRASTFERPLVTYFRC